MQRTRLGWVLYGGDEETLDMSVIAIEVGEEQEHVFAALAEVYFDLENSIRTPTTKGSFREDDVRAIQILLSTTRSLTDYCETGLLWNFDENPNKKNKRRLVFDAAAKVDGKSLNQTIL